MTTTAELPSTRAESRRGAENGPPQTVFRTHGLTLTNAQTFVVGSLLGYTATRIDLATCDPLPVDAVVSMDGTIRAGDQWMHLSGMARVESCEPTDYQVHRVRLALKGARWTNVADPEGRLGARVA